MTKSTSLPGAVRNSEWALPLLSSARLSHYLAMEDGDLQKAMARYRENLEFSANLYQWLALAEVLLRNELVASITPEGVHEENFDPFLHIWQDLRQEERADYFKAAQR